MESMIILKNLIVMIHGWVTFKGRKADTVQSIPSFYNNMKLETLPFWNTQECTYYRIDE